MMRAPANKQGHKKQTNKHRRVPKEVTTSKQRNQQKQANRKSIHRTNNYSRKQIKTETITIYNKGQPPVALGAPVVVIA